MMLDFARENYEGRSLETPIHDLRECGPTLWPFMIRIQIDLRWNKRLNCDFLWPPPNFWSILAEKHLETYALSSSSSSPLFSRMSQIKDYWWYPIWGLVSLNDRWCAILAGIVEGRGLNFMRRTDPAYAILSEDTSWLVIRSISVEINAWIAISYDSRPISDRFLQRNIWGLTPLSSSSSFSWTSQRSA